MIVRSAKISSFKIKKIVWCFCVDIDATKTSLVVKINHNTINRYFSLFRTLIYHRQETEFKRVIKGTAECDESYFGGKRRRGFPGKRGRGTDKQPVFGIYERGERVYTEIIPNCRKKILQATRDSLTLVLINTFALIILKVNGVIIKETILMVLKISGRFVREGLQSLTVLE